MKKYINAAVSVLTLALFLSACGGSDAGSSEPASSETQAESSVAAADTSPEAESSASEEESEEASSAPSEALPAAEESASAGEAASEETSSIDYEITGYSRTYPGIDDEDVRFVSSAEFIRITTPGYEALQASLDELNELNKSDADTAFANQAQEFAANGLNEYLQQLLPFSAESALNIERTDPVIFSLAVADSYWYGGAHPYSYQLGFNFDTKAGRAIELYDLVTDRDAFYEAVRTALSGHEVNAGFFDDWEDTLKKEYYQEEDYHLNWIAANDGIRIWFNQYDIAPYAAGPVELSLAAADYPELIKAEYFPEGLPASKDSDSEESGDKLYVYDLCNTSGSIEEEAGYTVSYHFRLPEIGWLETDDIKEINDEIKKLKSSEVDPELERIENGEAPVITHAGYTSVKWNGITSVRVSIDTPSDEKIYRCWNLHEDGTKATNEEVLALFDLTPEKFTALAKEALSERIDWSLAGISEDMAEELEKLREQTLGDDNVNIGLPLFITGEHGLGFIGGFYTPAGSGYVETPILVAGTEHRPDGLTRLDINPMSEENYTLKDGAYEVRDHGSEKVYIFDKDTVLIEGLPCYDDACDSMTWIKRYLDHPSNGSATGDAYSLSGFANGDILTILVDDTNHIKVLQEITYWD
ncbi:MAG: DUF3298 domain-containing protein [Lachnospiraceae bacterium]|nr:DUF3298 domain-containing protein [Lachnospiraceae bacterium]